MLSGYKKNTGKLRGGIRKILLAKANSIEKAEYDYVNNEYKKVTLKNDHLFANYEFQEDTAEYIEKIVLKNGIHTVKHTLSFETGTMDENSRNAVEQLLKATRAGIIAIIKTASDKWFIVGISRKYGTEKPLKMITADSSSGEKPSDKQTEKITLQSQDTSIAEMFAGEINFV